MRATFNGVTIAESDDTVVVDGNHYFPLDAIRSDALVPSDRTSVCPWKGTATYFDVVADGDTAPNAAWTYVEPKPAAAEIAGRVAFYPAVSVAD